MIASGGDGVGRRDGGLLTTREAERARRALHRDVDLSRTERYVSAADGQATDVDAGGIVSSLCHVSSGVRVCVSPGALGCGYLGFESKWTGSLCLESGPCHLQYLHPA